MFSGFLSELNHQINAHLEIRQPKVLSTLNQTKDESIMLTRTITKCAVVWGESVQLECTVPLGTWDFRNFKPEILSNAEKRPSFPKSGNWMMERLVSKTVLRVHWKGLPDAARKVDTSKVIILNKIYNS